MRPLGGQRSTRSDQRGGQRFPAGPPQEEMRPLGGQRSTRSDQRGGQHFESHANPGERRAQLVRGICQQLFVCIQQVFLRIHQGFNALGGGVETRRQKSHFVLTLHRHAGRQVTTPPALHAALQGFEPECQASNDRVSGQGHRQANQRQRPEKTKRWPHPRRAAGRVYRTRQMHGEGLAVAGRDQKIHFLVRPPVQIGLRRADDLAVGVADHDFTDGRLRIGGHAPSPADRQNQHRHGQHHGQPDAKVQMRGVTRPHLPWLSLAVGQTRSRHRAPSKCVSGLSRRLQWRCECGPCGRQSSGQRLRVHGRAQLP